MQGQYWASLRVHLLQGAVIIVVPGWEVLVVKLVYTAFHRVCMSDAIIRNYLVHLILIKHCVN